MKYMPLPDASIAPGLYGKEAELPIDGLTSWREARDARRRENVPPPAPKVQPIPPKPVFSEFTKRAMRREAELKRRTREQRQRRAARTTESSEKSSEQPEPVFLQVSEVIQDITPREDDSQNGLRENVVVLERRLDTYKAMLAAKEEEKKRDQMKVVVTIGELRQQLSDAKAEGFREGMKDGRAKAVKLDQEEMCNSSPRPSKKLTHYDLFNLPRNESPLYASPLP